MPYLLSAGYGFVIVTEDSPSLKLKWLDKKYFISISVCIDTFGAMNPSGGISPLLASDLILVPDMKSKSSFLWGSKKAMVLFLVS